MELTKELREYALKTLDVAEDASDETITAAIAKAMSEGTLDPATFAKMSAGGEDAMEALAKKLAEANKPILESLGKMADAVTKLADNQTTPPKDPEKTPDPKPDPKAVDLSDLEAKITKATEAKVTELLEKQQPVAPQSMAQEIMARGAKAEVREIKATERYSNTKSAAMCPDRLPSGRKHPMAGRPATFMGRSLDTTSQCDNAVNGAFAKMQLFGMDRLNEHEKQLVKYAMWELPWTGQLGGGGSMNSGRHLEGEKLTDLDRKTLIDDTTSGGSFAVPTPFDDAIILTPVLFGELFPLVEVINLPMGSSVDGHSMSDPTIVSGYTEGTGITLGSTASLVSNLDTTIFGNSSAIEIGLDFEADSPVNFGTLIAQRFGIKLQEWLDNQIANGDGTTEPEGIFTKTGFVDIDTSSGTSGPYVVADFEKLLFGLSKAMRASKGGRAVYVTSDKQYRLARAIPVGASDARRIFGMDHTNYTIFDAPVKIQEDITDGIFGFCNLAWYRMYRRAGINISMVTGGKTLALANTKIVMMRSRWGGQLTRGDALAKLTDGPISAGA